MTDTGNTQIIFALLLSLGAGMATAIGSCIAFFGRFQSRLYTKQTEFGPAEHTTYEVSIMHLAPEAEDENFSF